MSSPPNIFLIGFMASGKSHVGRILARKIGWPLVDADAEIVRRAGKSIEAIFQSDGEPAFRALEALVLAELCAGSGQVVATGGGAFINPECRQAMLDHGLVLCLSARPETISCRLGQTALELQDGEAGPVRPLLAGDDALERIKSLLVERAGVYSLAHYSIPTDDFTPEEVAGQIVEIWKAETSQGSSQFPNGTLKSEGA